MSSCSGTIDTRYINRAGRPFGGYVAAILADAVVRDVLAGASLLSMSVDFAAAPHEGPYTIETRNRRRNRSTDFWTAELSQADDEPGIFKVGASLVFARRRPTVEFCDARMPEVDMPEDRRRMDTALLPTFLSMYDMRIDTSAPATAIAGFPEQRTGRMWVRDDPPRALDAVSLVALCDTIVPQVFFHAGRLLPTSTVTMNVFVHANESELADVGTDYLLSDSGMHIATGGFFDSQTRLWSRSGRLIATTEQLAYYKLPVPPDASRPNHTAGKP